jgi:hypothetical protein
MALLFKMATLYFRVSIRALTKWGEKLRKSIELERRLWCNEFLVITNA